MLKWVEGIINQLGYVGIVLLMALENVFPPLPSEVIMPLAGFTASRGDLSLVGVIVSGMAGSVLGAIPLYWMGRLIGLPRLERWADRHGKWILISKGDLQRVQAWFERYGGVAVVVCRVIPGIRSLISIPAGFARMHFGLFLFYTAIGTAAWSALLAGAGTLLGENYQKVQEIVGPLGYVVLAAILIWLVLRIIRQNRNPKSST